MEDSRNPERLGGDPASDDAFSKENAALVAERRRGAEYEGASNYALDVKADGRPHTPSPESIVRAKALGDVLTEKYEGGVVPGTAERAAAQYEKKLEDAKAKASEPKIDPAKDESPMADVTARIQASHDVTKEIREKAGEHQQALDQQADAVLTDENESGDGTPQFPGPRDGGSAAKSDDYAFAESARERVGPKNPDMTPYNPPPGAGNANEGGDSAGGTTAEN